MASLGASTRRLSRPTLVTFVIVVLNVVVFFIQMMNETPAPGPGASPQELLMAMQPSAFERALWLDPQHLHWWSFITSAFLHANTMHLFGNMFVLWIFGPSVEDRLGRLGFAAFYVAGMFASDGLYLLMDGRAPVLGASGAISAVTGAYLVLFPLTRIWLYGGVPVPAWVLIALAIGKDFFASTSGRMGEVATWAHLGGDAMGIVVSLALLGTGVLAHEPWDIFEVAKVAKRRRDFRAAGDLREAAMRVRVKEGEDDRRWAAIASARAHIGKLLESGQMAAAGDEYVRLAESTRERPGEGVLSRKQQLDLANFFYETGRSSLAVEAYERFAASYADDREAAGARVMAGLICLRSLGDRARARRNLDGVLTKLRDDEHLGLAKALIAEVGPSPAGTAQGQSRGEARGESGGGGSEGGQGAAARG